jgi:GT2 family glycosyltransferase
MRNQSAKLALTHFPNNELLLRIDDDTLCEPDFLEKLLSVIDAGYDLASGVTPPLSGPDWTRETKYVKPCINRVVLDDLGNFLVNGDDCGHTYLTGEIIPTHHFRSTALYKREVHEKHDIWYEDNLTRSGMREEEFFSFRLILAGLKLGVHTQAVHYHLMCPSGGQRPEGANNHLMNQKILNRWVKKKIKEKGNFIEDYNKKVGISDENRFSNLDKSTNFLMTKEE